MKMSERYRNVIRNKQARCHIAMLLETNKLGGNPGGKRTIFYGLAG